MYQSTIVKLYNTGFIFASPFGSFIVAEFVQICLECIQFIMQKDSKTWVFKNKLTQDNGVTL